MDLKAEILSFIKEFGPAIGMLIISWYRDQAIIAQHDKSVLELEKKHLENKALIDEKFNGMSSSDIITKSGEEPK